jgi:Flp pilus assembly protein protease CpaA
VFGVFFSCIYLIYASYTDIKTREVSDRWLALFFVLGLAYSFFNFSFPQEFLPALLTLLISIFFYKIGMWAVGDVAIFATMALFVPMPPFTPILMPTPLFSYPLYPLLIFVNSILCTLPYLLAFLTMRAVKAKIKFGVRDIAYKSLEATYIILSCGIMASVFGQPLLALPFIPLFSFFKKKQLLLIPLILSVLLYPIETAMMALGQYAFLFLTIASFRVLRMYRKLLIRKVAVSTLKPGDIPAESIFLSGRKLIRQEGLKALSRKGTIIADRFNANGLEEEQIAKLRKLVKEGKMENYLMVKESAPMVPSFLAGLLFTVFLGDPFRLVA